MSGPPEMRSLAGQGEARKIEQGSATASKNTERQPTPQARWKAKNPLAIWCHSATESAVKRGIIVKGPCAVCGSTENVDLHHPRWDRPLETVSLCRLHHRQHHARERKAGEK